jgi:hypothetical protein
MSLYDFEQIVESHQEMVFRTLARTTGEREGLEDMAQEVFLRLFRVDSKSAGRDSLSKSLQYLVLPPRPITNRPQVGNLPYLAAIWAGVADSAMFCWNAGALTIPSTIDENL